MKAINLSPEAVELVNRLCDPMELEAIIIVLDTAEEQLQQLAFMGDDDTVESNNLYTVAYQVKMHKKELMKLKDLIENEKEGSE